MQRARNGSAAGTRRDQGSRPPGCNPADLAPCGLFSRLGRHDGGLRSCPSRNPFALRSQPV